MTLITSTLKKFGCFFISLDGKDFDSWLPKWDWLTDEHVLP